MLEQGIQQRPGLLRLAGALARLVARRLRLLSAAPGLVPRSLQCPGALADFRARLTERLDNDIGFRELGMPQGWEDLAPPDESRRRGCGLDRFGEPSAQRDSKEPGQQQRAETPQDPHPMVHLQ